MLRFHKVIQEVPVNPDPDAIYVIRKGSGFDLAVVDDTGNQVFSLNSAPAQGGPAAFVEKNPTFSYQQGQLSQITYSTFGVKSFSYYPDGKLASLSYQPGDGSATILKTFTYNTAGELISIAET